MEKRVRNPFGVLPHKIYRNIGALLSYNLGGWGYRLLSADDEKLVFKEEMLKINIIVGIVLIVWNLVFLPFLFMFIRDALVEKNWFFIFLSLPLLYIAYWGIKMLINLIRQWNYKYIYAFNRLKGTIEYMDKDGVSKEVSFSECAFNLYYYNPPKSCHSYSMQLRTEPNLDAPYNTKGLICSFSWGGDAADSEGHKEALIELHSYFIWYMDRNRPLPPGIFSEECRERDNIRREKEGNPTPLYLLTKY